MCVHFSVIKPVQRERNTRLISSPRSHASVRHDLTAIAHGLERPLQRVATRIALNWWIAFVVYAPKRQK